MRFLQLDDWLRWQETLHPKAIDPGLERTATVADRLGLRSGLPPVITVAGTNGKGTTAACLEALLRAAGRRPGVYTSPHLLRYNERIRIDGRDASDDTIIAAFDVLDRARGETSLSYFEFGTLAALHCFREAGCDAIVLEVGLGGRLDAVNVVDCDVAVITSIAVDHAEWLGNDRESIAREKAGIMRPGRPTVCADLQPPAAIARQADGVGSPLSLIGRDFDITPDTSGWQYCHGAVHHANLSELAGGPVSMRNLAAALCAFEQLPDAPLLDASAVRTALGDVRMPGRCQWLPGAPEWMVDVAHNPAAAAALAARLASEPCVSGWHAVFGLMRRKDLNGVAAALGDVVAYWHVLELPDPDAWTVEELRSTLGGVGIRVGECGQGPELFERVEALRAAGEKVVTFGSFRVAEEVLKWSRDRGNHTAVKGDGEQAWVTQ